MTKKKRYNKYYDADNNAMDAYFFFQCLYKNFTKINDPKNQHEI
jgi:hypothetical protein